MCVLQLLCDGSKTATILNEFSQKLERKKNLSSLVYVLKQNFPSATAEKSDRKVYVMRQMQKLIMFCLLKPKEDKAVKFLDLLEPIGRIGYII